MLMLPKFQATVPVSFAVGWLLGLTPAPPLLTLLVNW
jgi:hypothetical protein